MLILFLVCERVFTFQGELVYANYGEEKDFKLLLTKGVSCRDKIVIMRYGRIFPGLMVKKLKLSLYITAVCIDNVIKTVNGSL